MRLVKHLQYMKLLKLKMLILAEFFNVSLVVDFVAAATDVGAFFLLLLLQLLQLHICSCCVWSLFLVSSSSFLKSKSLSAFSRRYTMVSDALALFLGVAPPSSSPFLVKVSPSFSMDSFLSFTSFSLFPLISCLLVAFLKSLDNLFQQLIDF